MAGKPVTFLPTNLESGKKYGLVKSVHVQGITAEEKAFLNANPSVFVFHGIAELRSHPSESLDVLLVSEAVSETSTAEAWGQICEKIVPGGQIRVKFPLGVSTPEDASSRLLLGGFINSSVTPELVAVAEKPTWKPQASLPLKKKAKANALWSSLNPTDIVDEDALLGENDCGGTISPTGVAGIPVKKKACKNCSCGLAEAEKVTVDISSSALDEIPKKDNGGCGNCSRGDAFRCGGCPYLGTPAFTPGTKPVVVVKSDGTKSLQLDMTSEI